MEESVSNVIESLPEQYRAVVVEILGQRDPALLSSLAAQQQPTQQEREAVEDLLADALSENFGPGHAPTERGTLIEHTIDAFLERWPIDAE
jgi:hypothetical protein